MPVYATVNTYRLLEFSTMLVIVVVRLPTPPVTVTLFWSLSNCTVMTWFTLLIAPLPSYSNTRTLLTSVGLAKRFSFSLIVPSPFVSPNFT